MTEPVHLAETRAAYDTVAVDYAALVTAKLPELPLDRAPLGAFAELARAAGGRVADIGCGRGHVTAHLAALGVDAFGVDLSPRMVALARRAYPGLCFEVGSMTALDLPDGRLGGVLSWWSIVHLPRELLPRVFAEFHRVLAPGGHTLLGFHGGDDEHVRRDRAYGHPVSLDVHFARPEGITGLLAAAGLVVTATMWQAPGEGRPAGGVPVRPQALRWPRSYGLVHNLGAAGLSNRLFLGRRQGGGRRGPATKEGQSCDSPSPRS